jgi:hypothetical protein
MTYDLVAVGDVMLDVHLASAPLDAIVHGAIRVCAGGSAVNVARAARRLGASAAVVGRVGDDPAGAAIADDLRRHGIDALLEVGAGAVTGTVAYVGPGVVADRGANAGFTPGELPHARVTLVSGYLDTDAVGAALAGASGIRAVDLQRPGQRAFDADVVLGPELARRRLRRPPPGRLLDARGARRACRERQRAGARRPAARPRGQPARRGGRLRRWVSPRAPGRSPVAREPRAWL